MNNTSAANCAISIIVVTWNAKEYALECLNSLHKQSLGLRTEIIVVDNGSTDGTKEAIRQTFPDVKLIENQVNLGFARANNIGMALSRGKYVCLINSDVVVPSGCFEKMISFMEGHSNIGVLGPKMQNPDGSIGASVMRLPTVWNNLCCALGLHVLFPKSRLFGGYCMDAYSYDTIDNVEVLTGWFWLVSRTAFQAVGGLDEQFFMYGEDIDWCQRFHDKGWQVVFYPEAEALHYAGASSNKSPLRFYVEMRRANMQYFRKHHGWAGVFGYWLAIWIHEITRIIGYLFIYLCKSSRRSEASLKIGRSIACIRWLLGESSLVTTHRKNTESAARELL